jgi:hypothetical protein
LKHGIKRKWLEKIMIMFFAEANDSRRISIDDTNDKGKDINVRMTMDDKVVVKNPRNSV